MKEVGIKASRRRVRPGNGILFAATIILAVLFLAPVFFAIISAFKSNGEILKNPKIGRASCRERELRLV